MREYGDRPLELYDSRLTTFYRLLPAVPKEVVNQESTAGLTGNFLKVTSTEKLFDIPKVYSSMEGWYSYKPTDRPFSHQPFNDLWITCLSRTKGNKLIFSNDISLRILWFYVSLVYVLIPPPK